MKGAAIRRAGVCHVFISLFGRIHFSIQLILFFTGTGSCTKLFCIMCVTEATNVTTTEGHGEVHLFRVERLSDGRDWAPQPQRRIYTVCYYLR